jgi:hypothetical protein
LPIDPLSENTDWKCEACPVILSAEQVADLSGRIAMQVDQVLEVILIYFIIKCYN